ncbi:hypothetical protein ACJRO7_036031 [Eucalyptus globulus]|uniref:H(+)-exporting diphosphatase n=1 Tax=Eucalyptus globulus TaxID=34317 RepID=A0ABD3JER8_EUCGL
MAVLSALVMETAIPVCAVIGIAFSLVQWRRSLCYSDNEEGDAAQQRSFQTNYNEIKSTMTGGVKSFLLAEYQYAGVFVVAFAIVIFLLLGSVERFSTQSRPCTSNHSKMCKPALVTAVFSTVSFLLGAFTSVLFGSLGKKIAIYADARTALIARNIPGRTFRSCAFMGFLLAATDLLVLYLAINLFKLFYGNDWEGLFEAITGYALGGSSMALFGRASGGIYAKAADVCVHLVREIEPNCPQHYRNPAVISNCVGDIVGDIAGMGPDLFGSYAESSCAALVLASISSFGIEHNFTAMCYPLLISSMGILVCLITAVWWEIKPASKKEQFIISIILMTVGILVVSLVALPSSFTIYNIGLPKVVKNWQLSLCVGVGLWAGLISGFVDKKYTNDDFSCLRLVNDRSHQLRRCLPDDAAHNLCSSLKKICAAIFGSGPQAAIQNVSIAVGSVRIPFLAAVSIFVSYHFAATYGIAVAALGMLSTIATRLATDASGPISDNAKRIAMMAGVEVPDDAGNTTADTEKGFAIESVALVSIALLGAFVNRPAMSSSVDVLTPKVIVGVIMGTWLPYCFSAMTMKSVGRAGVKMAWEVLRQVRPTPDMAWIHDPPNYATCFEIATEASFRGMIGPVALVMFTPLIIGTVFGVEMLSGLLAGSLSAVVQIAISASNTDGAWIQAKEDIKAGALDYATKHCQEEQLREFVQQLLENGQQLLGERLLEYGQQLLEFAESGKTIGNPRRDTSGPPLNIVIQLMAVESLVLAPFFATHGDLLSKFL